jgi:dextranase
MISLGGEFVKIKNVEFSKSFYRVGEPVKVNVFLEGENFDGLKLNVYVMSLNSTIVEKTFKAATNVMITFDLPDISCGYGLDLYLVNSTEILSELHRGFDVMDSWIQRPKYGFLTDFSTDRVSPDTTMDFLAQYHINGLQYYDWMYNYGQLVYPGPGTDYTDAWFRTNQISETTLENLIKAGHKYNIASMAYVAIYAMTKELYEEHPDWALYEFNLGKWIPVNFQNKLIIAAPDNKGWAEYLINQCKLSIAKFGFDGIHLDQYGYPKDDTSATRSGTDNYHLYKTSEGFVNFINELKSAISSKDVFFNCVDDWPAKEVQSDSHENAVYIEPWGSCNTYSQLFEMINSARDYSNDKPIILAAYISHFFESSIFYADSLIFADGAQRLELGENGLILDGPYFPADAFPMSASFMQRLEKYYDYSVRYESLIYGEDVKSLQTNENISSNSEGISISAIPEVGKIFVLAKENIKTKNIILQFINYKDLSTDLWRNWQSTPQKLVNTEIQLKGKIAQELSNYTFYFVSPDNDLKMKKINISFENGTLNLVLPSLEYWSSVIAIPK